MLECEQEETIERERAHSHKVQAEIEKREQKREQQLLFGKSKINWMIIFQIIFFFFNNYFINTKEHGNIDVIWLICV